jgi:hypothetical protein
VRFPWVQDLAIVAQIRLQRVIGHSGGSRWALKCGADVVGLGPGRVVLGVHVLLGDGLAMGFDGFFSLHEETGPVGGVDGFQ